MPRWCLRQCPPNGVHSPRGLCELVGAEPLSGSWGAAEFWDDHLLEKGLNREQQVWHLKMWSTYNMIENILETLFYFLRVAVLNRIYWNCTYMYINIKQSDAKRTHLQHSAPSWSCPVFVGQWVSPFHLQISCNRPSCWRGLPLQVEQAAFRNVLNMFDHGGWSSIWMLQARLMANARENTILCDDNTRRRSTTEVQPSPMVQCCIERATLPCVRSSSTP